MEAAVINTMREAQHHLSKGEALFKALVHHSADIFILTNRTFRLDYISNAVIKILGYYPDELEGRSGFELIHPDDKETFAAWIAQLIERPSGVVPLELRMKNSIGSWVYLEASGQNMLQQDAENALVITCRDIQAIKIADQALLQAEQRLTQLLNNTKESFIILNNKLNIIAYNKAAQDHSPYFFIHELQSGLYFHDIIPPSEVADCKRIMELVLAGSEQQKDTTYTDEAGILHIYHHTFRAIDLGNEGMGVFITSANITEQRLAEQALKHNEERFKAIIENSFDAVVVLDENVVIKYVSPSVKNLLGFEPEELLGRSGFEFVFHEDIPEVQEKLMSIMGDIDETYADYRSITKSGELKWLEAKGRNMLSHPQISGILVNFRDITQRKKLTEEQTALTNELVKYNKDLQQFSFITSHNLRAPVANLLSLLALYNRTKLDDPFNGEILGKVDECTQQLNDTLNDLVNVLVIRTKPNADVEYVRFAEITGQVSRNVQSLLREINGVLHTDFSEVEGVEYNRVHLESIFLNLVSNAIKYASPERQLQINITSEKTEEGVRLSFQDNGIGIDLERYGDRMFGLYQRFHAGKQGKGLGLYMIKSQIVASGGSIKVQSTPGVGTTFFVHLKNKIKVGQ